MLSSLKFPKSIGRVNDADWAGSDKIVLSVADGYVAVTEMSLVNFMSPLTRASYTGKYLVTASHRVVGMNINI